MISALDLMQGMDALVPDEACASLLQEGAHFERIITYCGGGIAATVNAIAHLGVGHRLGHRLKPASDSRNPLKWVGRAFSAL